MSTYLQCVVNGGHWLGHWGRGLGGFSFSGSLRGALLGPRLHLHLLLGHHHGLLLLLHMQLLRPQHDKDTAP